MIVDLWYGVERAAHAAVVVGGVQSYRDVLYEVVDEWLSCILPNGNRIWYREPWVRNTWPHWHKPETEELCAAGLCDHKKRPQLSYMAFKNGQWMRVYTYGGKQTENYVQAVAREMLIPAALAVEAAGYPPILTVYDEVVVEVDKDFGSEAEFEELMVNSTIGKFAENWPIRASAWQGERYRK